MEIRFFDGAGSTLGTGHATADGRGCFTGDVQPDVPGASVQPATLTISDPSGGISTLGAVLTNPPLRPPRNPLPTP